MSALTAKARLAAECGAISRTTGLSRAKSAGYTGTTLWRTETTRASRTKSTRTWTRTKTSRSGTEAGTRTALKAGGGARPELFGTGCAHTLSEFLMFAELLQTFLRFFA